MVGTAIGFAFARGATLIGHFPAGPALGFLAALVGHFLPGPEFGLVLFLIAGSRLFLAVADAADGLTHEFFPFLAPFILAGGRRAAERRGARAHGR